MAESTDVLSPPPPDKGLGNLPVNGARRPSTLKLPAAFKFSGDGRHNGSGGVGSQRGESDGGSGGTAHRLGCTPVLGLRCQAAPRRPGGGDGWRPGGRPGDRRLRHGLVTRVRVGRPGGPSSFKFGSATRKVDCQCEAPGTEHLQLELGARPGPGPPGPGEGRFASDSVSRRQ